MQQQNKKLHKKNYEKELSSKNVNAILISGRVMI